MPRTLWQWGQVRRTTHENPLPNPKDSFCRRYSTRSSRASQNGQTGGDWASTNFTTSQSVLRLPDGSFRLWYAGRKQPPWSNLYFAIGTARWAGPGK